MFNISKLYNKISNSKMKRLPSKYSSSLLIKFKKYLEDHFPQSLLIYVLQFFRIYNRLLQ